MKTLGQLYEKDITRYLEGVIKADDTSHISQEVEEYVITDEISQKLHDFFESYNRKEGNNGVWLAGFFGSGKSHLLKMLSYLLENKTLEDGRKVGEIFVSKIKDNALLKGEIQNALRVPAKSILFNIDQKTEESTKKTTNPILSVFVKVFNEMQGYYASLGYIAEFERNLDQDELLDRFKSEYESIAGKTWEQGREEYWFEAHNIGQALHQVKGIPLDQAEQILEKMEGDYTISPESFADRVAKWLDQQGEDFRINFLVDEIGQYISNQTKLMLNLQTITETLATRCKGRAWVIVTSQQDIDAVVGNLDDRQNNDFSRIQDRFQIKLNLTSKNSDEVIMKRLFAKKEAAVPVLEDLYHQEHNNIKTLVQIEGRTFRDYQDETHFVNAYPVLPYQFTLLKMANESLAAHHAFLGRHRSVGERSLMDVFKTCGVATKDYGLRQFFPFDMAFEGLRPTLKTSMQSAINIAETNLNDDFAIRVLKALFLVKYVREFTANARNIGILLLDSLDVDLEAHQREVQQALNLLEQQIYIQRNEDSYEFLTNEEKDVEAEIKNMQLDPNAVTDQLKKMIFDEVLRDTKVRYEENKEDYAIGRMLDGSLMGREQELSVHIITPEYDRYQYQEAIISDTMGRSQLLMILPEDTRLAKDVRMLLQTERYIKHNRSSQEDAMRQTIIATKGQQNGQRRKAIISRLEELLGQARAYVNGQELELPPQSSARNRMQQGCQQLISRIYTNLRMIKTSFKEQDIASFITRPQDQDLFGGKVGLSEAEEEILTLITRNEQNILRTTVKDATEKFSKKPYGWPQVAILANIARLYRRNKIEVKYEGRELLGQELVDKLNVRYFEHLRLKPVASIDNKSVRDLQKFHRDLFHEANASNEPKAAANTTKEAFEKLATELRELSQQKRTYPFLADLESIAEAAGKAARIDWIKVYEDILPKEDEWLDWNDDLIQPLLVFMRGPQRKIYEEIQQFLTQGAANLGYLTGEEKNQLQALLDDPAPYRGGKLQEGKRALDSLKNQLLEQVRTEREQALAEVDQLIARFRGAPEYDLAAEIPRDNLLAQLEAVRAEIAENRMIPVIREKSSSAKNDLYGRLMNRLVQLATPPEPVTPQGETPSQPDGGEARPAPPAQPSYKVHFLRQISVGNSGVRLTTEADLDKYLSNLKAHCLEILEKGDQIEV